jgi:hypothetical protein
MKLMKVQYKVNVNFTTTNMNNIKQVINDLRAMDEDDISYICFLADDDQTFIHFVLTHTETANDKLQGLPSFQKFRGALKQSDPEEKPVVNKLTLVGSSFDLF